MEGITEFLRMISTVFGVAPGDFLMVSMTATILVVILRRCMQFNTKLAKVNKTEWGKLVLVFVTLGVGVFLAFMARRAGIYSTENTVMLIWIGFWNGALSSLLWQGAKRLKALRQFTEGKDR